MGPDQFLIFVFAMATLGAVTKVTLAVINRGKSQERLGSGTASADLAQMREQLTRLEHAMEAVAVEVERLGEGQRFTTRLLSERAGHDQPAAGSAQRPITPH